MGDLFERVRGAVRAERYLFSDHADNMLRERQIMHWQVVSGLDQGKPLAEHPAARPNPVVEVEQVLADGTSIRAVWAYVRELDFAKLVTVHFFDR